MSKFLDFVKEHPVGLAIGSAVIVGGYILFHGGSSASAATGDDSSYLAAQAAEVQAGSQYQVAQLQANAAALQTNNQAAVANNQITAQEMASQLQSTDTLASIAGQVNIAGIQGAVQENSDTLSAQTTQAVSLLQAQVAENQTNNQTDQMAIAANAEYQIAALPYDSITPQLIAQLNTNTSDIASLTGTVGANSQAIANSQSAISILSDKTNNLANFTLDEVAGLSAKGIGGPVAIQGTGAYGHFTTANIQEQPTTN